MSKPKKSLVPPTRCVWESPSGNVVLDQHGVSVVSLPPSLDADALQVLMDAVRNAHRFTRTEHAPTPKQATPIAAKSRAFLGTDEDIFLGLNQAVRSGFRLGSDSRRGGGL